MEFENVRIVKEMRNNVNRVVNCETANLNKVVQAAVEQLESIRYLEKKGHFWQAACRTARNGRTAP